MTKQALIEALERLAEQASRAGLPDHEIIDAMDNVLRAMRRYRRE